jgi:hypothetical protein
MARTLLKALPAEPSRFRERWSAHSLDVYLLGRDYRRARRAERGGHRHQRRGSDA